MLKRKKLIIGAILMYVITLGALVSLSRLPAYVPCAIFLLSIISYLTYRNDKRAAEQRGWRTPENCLHVLSLFGGWPGAMIAQNHLRHKSSKPGFRTVFYITIFLNIATIGYLTEKSLWKSLVHDSPVSARIR
jgi:uncharacterized membrane protein YsdA (DUF1294 family)